MWCSSLNERGSGKECSGNARLNMFLYREKKEVSRRFLILQRTIEFIFDEQRLLLCGSPRIMQMVTLFFCSHIHCLLFIELYGSRYQIQTDTLCTAHEQMWMMTSSWPIPPHPEQWPNAPALSVGLRKWSSIESCNRARRDDCRGLKDGDVHSYMEDHGSPNMAVTAGLNSAIGQHISDRYSPDPDYHNDPYCLL